MILKKLFSVFFVIVILAPTPRWGLSQTIQEEDIIIILDEIGTPMVYVPSGVFELGYDAKNAINICLELNGGILPDPSICVSEVSIEPYLNNPQEVEVEAFFIDQFEVSRLDYIRCMTYRECHDGDLSEAFRLYPLEPIDFPMQGISPSEAQYFCESRGARLPTEIEWEYAARGEENLVFPWGNEFDGTVVNFCDVNCEDSHANQDWDDGYTEFAPVDSLENGKSWIGVYHLGGNISEWTVPDRTPLPEDENVFIVKGGAYSGSSFSTVPWMSTNVGNLDSGQQFVGFRCARTPDDRMPPPEN